MSIGNLEEIIDENPIIVSSFMGSEYYVGVCDEEYHGLNSHPMPCHVCSKRKKDREWHKEIKDQEDPQSVDESWENTFKMKEDLMLGLRTGIVQPKGVALTISSCLNVDPVRRNLVIKEVAGLSSLADFGRMEIDLAEVEMPGLMACRAEFGPSQPFKGARITGSLHVFVWMEEIFTAHQVFDRMAELNVYVSRRIGNVCKAFEQMGYNETILVFDMFKEDFPVVMITGEVKPLEKLRDTLESWYIWQDWSAANRSETQEEQKSLKRELLLAQD